MYQPQVGEGQLGGRWGEFKSTDRAPGPRSDMEGTRAAVMGMLPAPPHLLPLRMQSAQPTYPPIQLLPASASPTLPAPQWFPFLGHTPFTKLQRPSLPLLLKAFPNQDFHNQHSQSLKDKP